MLTSIRVSLLCLVCLLALTVFGRQSGSVKTANADRQSSLESSIETALVPEKATVMIGEPAYLSFVVNNLSDQGLQIAIGGDYRNALGRPESFKVIVIAKNGDKVPQPDAGPGFGGVLGTGKLPAKGSYTFKLFLPDWAIFSEAGNYTITASRELSLIKDNENWEPGNERAIRKMNVEATTTIRVVPRDTIQMAQVIDELGNALMDKDNPDTVDTVKSLSRIDDERTIPWLVKAFESRNSYLQFAAVQALSKFNNEEAFEILKRAMDTKADDIPAASEKLAEGAAESMRLTAANALAVSKYPGSIPFLLTRRFDKSENIRLTVVHTLGKMKSEEAADILKEMSHDKKEIVRNEASRYLQEYCKDSGRDISPCKGIK